MRAGPGRARDGEAFARLGVQPVEGAGSGRDEQSVAPLAAVAGQQVMRRVTPRVTPALDGRGNTEVADHVLTSAEAAALLRVSVDTLLTSDVPWFTVGRGRKRPRRLYLQSALIEWARRRQATGWRARRPRGAA
jgi:hypothetical protein